MIVFSSDPAGNIGTRVPFPRCRSDTRACSSPFDLTWMPGCRRDSLRILAHRGLQRPRERATLLIHAHGTRDGFASSLPLSLSLSLSREREREEDANALDRTSAERMLARESSARATLRFRSYLGSILDRRPSRLTELANNARTGDRRVEDRVLQIILPA
jgi:hypothetical protein